MKRRIDSSRNGSVPNRVAAFYGVVVMLTILMLVPVVTVAINHHLTTRGNHGLVQYSPTMRFTVFGAVGLRDRCVHDDVTAERQHQR